MSKPIIAVDMDEVLAPHFKDLADWYNGEYGTALTLADNHSNDLTKWGTPDEETAIRRVHKFYDTEVFQNAQPFEEAKAVLRKLSQRYKLVVITARETIIEESTREWLDKHFQEFFHEVHFTEQYSLEGKSRTKADVCLEIGAEYMIDDDLNNILPAHEAGVRCVLFAEYPWNIDKALPEGVTRCKDWAAVEEYFDGRS